MKEWDNFAGLMVGITLVTLKIKKCMEKEDSYSQTTIMVKQFIEAILLIINLMGKAFYNSQMAITTAVSFEQVPFTVMEYMHRWEEK